MRGLGILCRSTEGLPEVHSVLVVGDRGGVEEHEVDPFTFVPSPRVALPGQLSDLSRAFASYLAGDELDAIVVRTVDFHRNLRITDGLRNRFHAEGVLLEQATARVGEVREMSGRDIGQVLGIQKAEAVAMGEALVGKQYRDEAAAALAAVHISA